MNSEVLKLTYAVEDMGKLYHFLCNDLLDYLNDIWYSMTIEERNNVHGRAVLRTRNILEEAIASTHPLGNGELRFELFEAGI